jgi:hypothetical protein
MLEEQGVQVGQRDEGEVLSIVASGALDTIKAAVAQLSHEFPNSSPVVIEGEDRAEPAVTEREDRAEDADAAQFDATEPLPAIPTSSASGIPEEVRAQPDIDVQPEPATAAPEAPARPPKAATSARMHKWLRLNWWIAVLVLVWLSLAAYNLLANSR